MLCQRIKTKMFNVSCSRTTNWADVGMQVTRSRHSHVTQPYNLECDRAGRGRLCNAAHPWCVPDAVAARAWRHGWRARHDTSLTSAACSSLRRLACVQTNLTSYIFLWIINTYSYLYVIQSGHSDKWWQKIYCVVKTTFLLILVKFSAVDQGRWCHALHVWVLVLIIMATCD